MMKKKKKKKVPLDLEDLDTVKAPQVPQPETDTNKENESVDGEDAQSKKKEAGTSQMLAIQMFDLWFCPIAMSARHYSDSIIIWCPLLVKFSWQVALFNVMDVEW